MFHIVEFHGDGGQMCVLGRRVFTDPSLAEKFADEKRNEQGHNCGPKSVRLYTSEISMENIGQEYPTIAGTNR
ncbi:MAG: hypothetical protein Q8L57_02725 [bacterium]|nr:hypothetical protein [bacterium]